MKIGCFGSLALFAALVTALIWPYLSFESDANRNQFKAAWTARLRPCRILPAVKALPQPRRGSLDCRVFADGSWIAVAWHCFHDEEYATGKWGTLSGVWDGAVLRDSTGRMFWTTHHFCGYEGFSEEFLYVPAKSLGQFYKHAAFGRRAI
jgi:hypothetical protein